MIKIKNMDCMLAMKDMPNNHYDLAIVDPPYGIGGGSCVTKKVNWDDTKIPPKKYFNELIRVSKNQIIWGGNYMSKIYLFAVPIQLFGTKKMANLLCLTVK